MVSTRSYVRIGLVLTAVLAAPGLDANRFGPLGRVVHSEAIAQEAATYLDELLMRARELLRGQWAEPEIAVGILEELIAAGSVEATFELVGYYVENVDDQSNFERAKGLLDDLIVNNPDVAARAWSVVAELYLADSAMHDAAKAREAYREAVALGDTSAMINLAGLLAVPEQGEADIPAAIELLSNAASAGDPNAARAWYSLATVHVEAGDSLKALAAFRTAAELGNSSAMVQLASMLVTGDGGADPDLALAEDLLKHAIVAEPDNAAWAWGVMAEVDIRAGDLSKAIGSYQNAVDLGSTWAMINLAGMLAAGEGVAPPNPAAAITLLLRAAAVDDQNAGRAWSALAELYRLESDAEKAANAYRRAADLGSTSAMINYATMIGTAAGSVVQDAATAKEYLTRAIAAEDENAAWAWSILAGIYAEEADVVKATDAYRHAAELGETSAMISLALILTDGDQVVASDESAAIALLERATEAGDRNAARAWNALARLHRKKGDVDAAAEAFAYAADLGSSAAMIDLATLVGMGDGIGDGPDFPRAMSLLNEAIAAEDENAAWAWGVAAGLYLAESDFSDAEKGREAYTKAAELGDTAAMINLAEMVAKGEGGAGPDLRSAIALLSEAAEVNDANAPRAWNDLALLYLQTGDRQRALEYFSMLAATGDGFAHLSAAEIISTRLNSPAARQELVTHFRAAAEVLGNRSVAQAMLRISTVALYAAVQALLVDAGYQPGSVDGVFGPRTVEALTQFCADRQVEGCLPSVVTVGLLTELLGLRVGTSG